MPLLTLRMEAEKSLVWCGNVCQNRQMCSKEISSHLINKASIRFTNKLEELARRELSPSTNNSNHLHPTWCSLLWLTSNRATNSAVLLSPITHSMPNLVSHLKIMIASASCALIVPSHLGHLLVRVCPWIQKLSKIRVGVPSSSLIYQPSMFNSSNIYSLKRIQKTQMMLP